jgi:hypothetical protein
MTKKIVINTSSGGDLDLSPAGWEMYAQRKGGALHARKSGPFTFHRVELPDGAIIADISIDRTDADLVAVIEELGTEVASGRYSRLEIVTIPDDVTQWFIVSDNEQEYVFEGWRGRQLMGVEVQK